MYQGPITCDLTFDLWLVFRDDFNVIFCDLWAIDCVICSKSDTKNYRESVQKKISFAFRLCALLGDLTLWSIIPLLSRPL